MLLFLPLLALMVCHLSLCKKHPPLPSFGLFCAYTTLFAHSLFAVLMIIAGYMGAVSVVTTVKWFWFLFGMAMFLPVVYSLARTFRETVITRKVCQIAHAFVRNIYL